MQQITPLPPEEKKPEPILVIPDSLIESTAPESTVPEAGESAEFDTLPEDAVLALPEDDTDVVLEGQFEDVPPEELALEENTAEKPRMKPAIFALITILVLIALCCLMSIIVYFMVLPAMLESRTVGALFPTMKDLLSVFK